MHLGKQNSSNQFFPSCRISEANLQAAPKNPLSEPMLAQLTDKNRWIISNLKTEFFQLQMIIKLLSEDIKKLPLPSLLLLLLLLLLLEIILLLISAVLDFVGFQKRWYKCILCNWLLTACSLFVVVCTKLQHLAVSTLLQLLIFYIQTFIVRLWTIGWCKKQDTE